MCGIVTKIWHKPINSQDAFNDIINMFDNQRSRGTQGMGFVAINDDLTVKRYRSATEDGLMENIEKIKGNLMGVMFHHRYPTSTINIENCAHPIYVSHKELKNDYYVIHNGVISGCDEIKKKHNELGYVYETEYQTTNEYMFKRGKVKKWTSQEESAYNDSETLAIETARYLEGKTTVLKLTGSYAVVVLEVSKETKKATKMHYFRNAQNPLINDGTGFLCLRSVGKNAVKYNAETKTWSGHQGGITSDSINAFTLNTVDLTTKRQSVKPLATYAVPTYPSYGRNTFGFHDRYDDWYDNDKIYAGTDSQAKIDSDMVTLAELNEQIDELQDELEEEKDPYARRIIQEELNRVIEERHIYTKVLGL